MDLNFFKAKLIDSKTKVGVTFDVTPDISESGSVTYKTVDPLHAPGSILVYALTPSRVFQVSSIRLISDTTSNADMNLRTIQLLRSWRMPRFGQPMGQGASTTAKITEKSKLGGIDGNYISSPSRLGTPPPVLLFSAYSNTNVSNKMQHINRIPVVIENLNITYPSDVDYVPTSSGVPMPIIMSIDLTLKETHSPNEYDRFNLDDYRNGILKGF